MKNLKTLPLSRAFFLIPKSAGTGLLRCEADHATARWEIEWKERGDN